MVIFNIISTEAIVFAFEGKHGGGAEKSALRID